MDYSLKRRGIGAALCSAWAAVRAVRCEGRASGMKAAFSPGVDRALRWPCGCWMESEVRVRTRSYLRYIGLQNRLKHAEG
jgi:hypothetical protein